MGKIGKKKQQIQRRLELAQQRRKQVLREVRSRLGVKKGGRSEAKRKRNADGVPESKVKKLRGFDGEGSELRGKQVKKQSKLEDVADDLLQDVDFVKFGERVDAPPKISTKGKNWGDRGGLQCVKVLQAGERPAANPKNGSGGGKDALREHAVKAYRAYRKQQSGKKDAGRATMESLKRLVQAGEDTIACPKTSKA